MLGSKKPMPFRIEEGHGWYVWDQNEREYVLNFCHGTYSHYELKPDYKAKVAKPRLICDRCGQDISDAIDLRSMVDGTSRTHGGIKNES